MVNFVITNDVKDEGVADAINANADVKSLKESFADAFDGFEDMLHEHLITNVLSVNEMKRNRIIADDIFRRLKPVALVDKYTTYQALANNWQTIVNDIETIQSDGIDAKLLLLNRLIRSRRMVTRKSRYQTD